MRGTTGSAAAPVARCRNRLRGSFILNLSSHHSITSSAATLPLSELHPNSPTQRGSMRGTRAVPGASSGIGRSRDPGPVGPAVLENGLDDFSRTTLHLAQSITMRPNIVAATAKPAFLHIYASDSLGRSNISGCHEWRLGCFRERGCDVNHSAEPSPHRTVI